MQDKSHVCKKVKWMRKLLVRQLREEFSCLINEAKLPDGQRIVLKTSLVKIMKESLYTG